MTVLTDGRKQYIEKSLPTWIEQYDSQIDNKFIIDDSGDPEYRDWLSSTFPSFKIIPVAENRAGYVKAMRKVFSTVLDSGSMYCLHIEDDFILLKPFVIDDVIKVLQEFPELSQMSFMRQPWYKNEIVSGGVIDALEKVGCYFNQRYSRTPPYYPWVIHKAFWTCNPSIFPAWVAKYTWPESDWSESEFGKKIRSEGKVSGIWGDRKTDWISVEHIGKESNGTKN
jgi:hypothetical protein